MAIFMDLKGTSQSSFQIQKGGPRLKNNSGVLEAKNAADSAYVDFKASALKSTSNTMTWNEDASLAGADWKMQISRPTSGMTANTNFVMPADYGTNGYVLQTDGAGNLSWVAQSSPPSVTQKITVDTTTLAFNTSSPLALFTLPANAVVHKVKVIIDTAFDGAPTLDIGISGNTSKYGAAAAFDLTSGAGDRWESNPNQAPVGTTEALIATYAAGGATVGSARIEVDYSIPA
ncbi:MAG: hypothetical protein H7836_04510 [Magnetococcus sp. YQC-3]